MAAIYSMTSCFLDKIGENQFLMVPQVWSDFVYLFTYLFRVCFLNCVDVEVEPETAKMLFLFISVLRIVCNNLLEDVTPVL